MTGEAMNDYSKKVTEILNKMKEMAKPALRLATAHMPGFSKTGGKPNLPEGLPWPFWKDRPLSFVVQIDLAELKAAETLPEFPAEGRLYFFYPNWWQGDNGHPWQPWGTEPDDAGSAVVIYSLDEPGPPQAPPEEMNQPGLFLIEDTTGVYEKRYIGSRPIVSWPDPYTVMGSDYDLTEEEDEKLWEAYSDLEQSQVEMPHKGPDRHQLGGYHYPIQCDDLPLVCNLASNGVSAAFIARVDLDDPTIAALAPGARDWLLLLQLDSDEGIELPDDNGDMMIWGNHGQIYFWIRRQDLAACDFSQIWAIIEST